MKFAAYAALVVSTLLTSCGERSSSPEPAEPTVLAVSAAPSKTVLGIELGMPLVAPPCASKSDWDVPATCWRHYEFMNKKASGQPPADGMLHIVFSAKDLPTGVLSVADTDLINGNVESIDLHTLGDAFQESIYQILVAKWGQPQIGGVKDLQNGFGAQFQSIESQWEFSEFTVLFLGMTTRESGLVQIRTSAYNRRIAENKASQEKSL